MLAPLMWVFKERGKSGEDGSHRRWAGRRAPEPGKGANCLSAASFRPAGSGDRRTGSSQRRGCPFFWFLFFGHAKKRTPLPQGDWGWNY